VLLSFGVSAMAFGKRAQSPAPPGWRSFKITTQVDIAQRDGRTAL
jgi:hypothetical protein